MSKRKSTKGLSAILSSMIILLVVVTVVGFLFIFTNDFTTDLKTFYVKYGNDEFIGDRDNYSIVLNKDYEFEVVNPLNMESGFEVCVLPNNSISESNFTFYVNNTYHQFSYEEDLTDGFEIIPYGKGFRFKATKDLNEIMQSVYPDKTISGCPSAVNSEIPYFRLQVRTSDGSQSININFSLMEE